MKNPSVALRVIVFLTAAQLLALIITWIFTTGIGLTGLTEYELFLDDLALPRTDGLVIDSLVKGADGRIRLEPSPELHAEMQRVPGLRFAAFELGNGDPVQGSDPELAASLKNVMGAKAMHLHFAAADGISQKYLGHLAIEKTPFGSMQIASFDRKFQWIDIFYSLKEHLAAGAIYSSGAVIFVSMIGWIAVRRGMAPVTAVARSADKIDMNSLKQRLPIDGAPAEIKPLVDAVNNALSRLDASAARMRRYTANVAHELRTPLAIMRARLEDTEEPTFKNDLLRDASHLQAIVEQMLITARLTERQAPLDQKVDLVETIRQSVSDYMPLVIESGREITFEAERPVVTVSGNKRAIECIVANLIDNALRTEPERGTIVVRVGDCAVVEVVDHGEGVAVEDREKIFEPFWRKSDAHPGTGLGLTIAKELMEALGGQIWVEETPDGGATFKLRFPRAEGA